MLNSIMEMQNIEFYDYEKEMAADIKNAIENDLDLADLIEEYGSIDNVVEYLDEYFWTNDAVTGNASGSYWFNSFKAEKALCGNWDLVGEMMEEFCVPPENLLKGPEWIDVSIRCYLLRRVLGKVMEDLDMEAA